MKPSDYLKIAPPENFDKAQISALREAFGKFYDQGAKSFSDPVTKLHFDKVEDFVDYVYSIGIPKGTSAKNIGIVLENWHESTLTAAPEYAATSNTLTPEQLKAFQKQAETVTEQIKETETESKSAVETALERKKEIYAKTKIENPPKGTEEVIEQIKNAPTKEAIDQTKNLIQERVPEVTQETAEITAAAIVINVQTNFAPQIETKVVEKGAQVSEKSDLATILSDQSKSLAELQNLRDLTQNVTKLAFGEEFQKAVLPEVAVEEISDVPSPGFVPIQIPAIYKETAQAATKMETVSFGQTWVQVQLSQMGTGGIQGTNYDPKVFQSSFSSFKPLVGAAKNFALGQVKKIATKAVTKAVGAEVGAEIGAAVGAPTGPGALITAAIGAAIGWVADHINWKKVKEWSAAIFGGIAFLLVLPFGIGAAIAAGLLATGISMGLGAGMGGVTLGTIGGGIVSFFGAVGSATLGAIGPPILFTLLGFPVIVALILFIINSGAYVVPPAPISVSGTQNPYIEVTKTANPPGPFENTSLPLKITYTVTIAAKKETLTNVSFTNECNVTTKSGSQKCTAPTIQVPNGTVSVGNPFTFSYDVNYNPTYKDSLVTDTVTVSANVISQSHLQKADATASIKIGNPPEDCPSIWPTNHGIVTQGAYTSSSHVLLEAIDIGVSHVGVMATHQGTVVHAQTDSCYGNNIEIKSTCGGKTFVSRYAHLDGMKVKVGQTITAGQQIGLSGNTTGGKPSCSTGAHLHYDFDYWPGVIPTKYPNNPPFMMKPYIPQNVKRGCVDNCGVTW